MSLNIPVRWSDNTAELRAHLKEGLNQIEATRAGTEKMIASLSGDKLITAAHKYTAALSEMGGAQGVLGGAMKLTGAELDRVAVIIQKATDKYKALGKEIPTAIQELQQFIATTKQVGESSMKTAGQLDAMAAGMSAAGKTSVDSARMIAGMSASGTEAAKGLSKADSGILSYVKSLGSMNAMLGTVGLGVGVGSLVAMGKAALEDADALTKLSDKTDVGVETLQRWRIATDDAGNSLDDLAGAVNKMQKNFGTHNAGAIAAVEELGLSFDALSRMGTEEKFYAIAAALAKVEDADKQVALATAIMGKGAADVLPTMKRGFDDVKDAAVSMSKETIFALDQLGDTIQAWKRRITGGAGAGTVTLLQMFGIVPSDEILRVQQLAAEIEKQLKKIQPGVPGMFRAPGAPGVPADLKALDALWERQTDAIKKTNQAAEEYQRKLDAINKKIREATRDIGNLSQAQQDEAIALDRLGLSAEDIGFKIKASAEAVKRFLEVHNDLEKALERITTHVSAQAIPAFNGLLMTWEQMLNTGKGLTYDGLIPMSKGFDDLARAELAAQLHADDLAKSQKALQTQLARTIGLMPDLSRQAREHMRALTEETKQVVSLSDTLGKLAHAFTQLATISQGSLGTTFKALAGATVAAKAMVDAIDATQAAFKAASEPGGSFDPKTLVSLAAGWIGVAVAIYQVAASLWEAHKAAVKVHEQLNFYTELANQFHNATKFSDELNKSIKEMADSALVDMIAKNLERIYGIGGLGRNSQELRNAVANVLKLGDIIKELGGFAAMTGDQLHDVLGVMSDAFLVIEAGGTGAVKATEQLDDALSELGQAGIDAGGLVSQAFLDMVKRAQAAGVELAKVTDLLQKQAQSAEDGILRALKVTDDAYKKRADLQQQIAELTAQQQSQTGAAAEETAKKIAALNKQLETQNKIIQATGIHSAEIADSMAGGLLDIIGSQVAAGKSFGDAIRAVAPGIEALETQMRELGLTGGPAFNFLRTQVELFQDEVAGPALTAIEGWAQGLRGLHNAGLLNQDTFAGLANQIGATRDALVAQGKDPKNVLIAMQGPLQTLWELEQKFGYTTDAATQELIDQAVAQGLVGEKMKPVQEQMLDATLEIRDAINDLVVALGGVPGAGKKAADGLTDSFGNLKIPPVVVPLTYTTPGAPTPPGAAHGGYVTAYGVQQLASGGLVRATGTDTVPILATPGEGIVTRTGMALLGQVALAALNHGPDAYRFFPLPDTFDSHTMPVPTTDYSGLDGVKTITAGKGSQDWAELARGITGSGTTVTGGGGGGEIHYHEWSIAISALDATDLQHKVEHEILPMVIAELEDNRRSAARRMASALHRAQ